MSFAGFMVKMSEISVLDYLLLVMFQALTIAIIFALKMDTNRRLDNIEKSVNRYMQIGG